MGVPLAAPPDMVCGDQALGKSQKVFPEQQPELSWVFQAGGRWEQRTWKSEFCDRDIYGYSD